MFILHAFQVAFNKSPPWLEVATNSSILEQTRSSLL